MDRKHCNFFLFKIEKEWMGRGKMGVVGEGGNSRRAKGGTVVGV